MNANAGKREAVCAVPDPVTNRGVIYEPPYLFETDPYPNYASLAVSIRGYDYVVLEGYFRYIQKLAKSLDIQTPDAYALTDASLRRRRLLLLVWPSRRSLLVSPS